jgi:uncharacterized membrane protein
MRKVSSKNILWLKTELSLLEAENIISPETGERIRSYYSGKTASGIHWAVIAFAIFGSLLISSGIILLFAHNWDELSHSTRAALSFSPLLIGSILSAAALARNGGVALRESAGIFHSLAVGASISLIGQTYHIPSNVPGFMLSWSLLILPLVFLLRSTGAYLIYLTLACGWSCVAQETYGQAVGFWLLMLPAIVRLYTMVRHNRHAPDTLLSFLGLLLALCISTGITFERTIPGLWIIAYSALLSTSGLLGLRLYDEAEGWINPPKTIGVVGMILLTYLFTWPDMWSGIGWNDIRSGWHHKTWGIWVDSGITLTFLSGWLVTAINTFRRDSLETITLASFPILGTVCFFIGSSGACPHILNAIIFNAFMLFLGIMYIVTGCRNAKLRKVNGGMAILSLLLITRFFDGDFGFLARGITFITLGVCFLIVNLALARRKKYLEVAS